VKSQDSLDLAGFKELMLQSCGFSFESDRAVTLERALRRRMQALQSGSGNAYLAQLYRDKQELDRLIELLTVNETYFFREADHLRLLMDRLLPELMRAANGAPVRILSAGCSTGEEPYSVAMMLRERYGEESERMFCVVGVDIDAAAIAAARQGKFRKGSFRGVDEAMRQRYFEPCGNDVSRLRAEVRAQVEFAVVNLLGPCYPDCMQHPDIILYRNVSIYSPQAVQREIFRMLAGVLREGCYFLVGATETMHHDIGILSLIELDSLFLYRKIPGIVIDERRGPRQNGALPPRGRTAHAATPVVADSSAQRVPVATPPPVPPWPASAPEQRSATGGASGSRRHFDDALEKARSNRYEEALAILAALVAGDGTLVRAHSLRGSILVNLDRFEEARSACDRVLTLDPLCIEGHLMLGVIARHQGDNDQALRRFRQSIYLNSACWLANFYLAEIVFAAGDKNRAFGGYQSTLRILESSPPGEQSRDLFPLSFNTEQFLAICRHKLSLLRGNG